MKKQLIPFLMFATLGAACGDATDESPDGRDDVAFADGKADNLFGDCEANNLLSMLNNPTTTVDDLKVGGLHTRAAKNIISKRNGSDGTAGTNDDFIFETMLEVDKVSFVGKVAMNQLASLVSGSCSVIAAESEVIMSPQQHSESHLARVAELIDGAETSVDIAMYSFSDAGIKTAMERAVDRGVNIRMIFESANKEKNKQAGSKSAGIEEIGVDVRYINKIMHHKYAIIDGPREILSQDATDDGILATGSGNWSNSAGTRYDENTVFVFGNSELNMKFQQEFNYLWANSRDFKHTETFEFFETDTIEDSMIPDDPSVDAVFTSANFKTFTSAKHGKGFSVIRGENAVSDRIVEEIQNATKSIRVASGHLRSRPVSLALIEKVKANPNFDIKVYLDGQEYVSEFSHDKEVEQREACLVKAGTSTAKQQDCMDKGFHYAFDIFDAGIDMRFKHYAFRWHFSYAAQMHHKYLIIDGTRVISGSYNLSDNAEHNTMENMVIYDEAGFPDIVEAFVTNFDEIYETGTGSEYDELMEEVENDSSFPIVYDSMALTYEQVRDLKRAMARECPKINSIQFRTKPESHFSCSK